MTRYNRELVNDCSEIILQGIQCEKPNCDCSIIEDPFEIAEKVIAKVQSYLLKNGLEGQIDTVSLYKNLTF